MDELFSQNVILDTEPELQKDGRERDKEDIEDVTINIKIQCKAATTDDLFKICGDTGVWQIMVFFLGSLCGFNCAIQNFSYIFIADTPDHWCNYHDAENFTSKETLKKLLIPKDPVSGDFESCVRYNYRVSENGSIEVDKKNLHACNIKTMDIQYEHDEFAETIGTEWSLVCQDSFWISSIEAIYMVGLLSGSIVFGIMSDRHGRKYTIWISSFMFLLFSVLVALAPNFVTVLIFRFLLGMASPGVYSASYVLVVEAIGNERRGLAGTVFAIPYSVGYMVLPVIAYFIRDWRYLQLTLSSLSSLLIITWWYIPESPRWLLLKGRATEAEIIMRQIAHLNGREKELPPNFSYLVAKVASNEMEHSKNKSCSLRCRECSFSTSRLLGNRKLRFRVFVMSISFVAVSMVYYGLAINPMNLGFDRYLFTFLCGLFEIPANLMIPVTIERAGRKLSFSGFFFASGVFLVASLALPIGSPFSIVLIVAAQLMIAANSSLIYLYSSELFPTEVRSFCLGICSMIGRTGSISVPFIVELVGKRHKTYPTIIFGAVSLLAGALTLFLPETMNKKLPDTVEDIEKKN